MADWSDLPQELPYLISLLLTSSIDFLRLRSVCTTWRASVQPRLCPASSNPLIPSPYRYNRRFRPFGLAKQTIFAVQLPNNHDLLWIIRLGQKCIRVLSHLYHPLNILPIKIFPQNIPRPFSFLNLRVRELGEEYLTSVLSHKVAVLKGLDNAFVLLTIEPLGDHHLYIYKSGTEEWKVINDGNCYYDVILMAGAFYAIRKGPNGGSLVRVNHIDLSLEIIASSPVLDWYKKFLLECNGSLLLVDLCCSNHHSTDEDAPLFLCSDDGYEMGLLAASLERPFKLGVFRLDENLGKWVEVNHLGNMILFVGYRCAFSASAKDIFAENATYGKGNCIFYYDGDEENVCVRVIDLETGTVKQFDSQPGSSVVFWPPPAWAYSAANQ